jgi:hypothetical protein
LREYKHETCAELKPGQFLLLLLLLFFFFKKKKKNGRMDPKGGQFPLGQAMTASCTSSSLV